MREILSSQITYVKKTFFIRLHYKYDNKDCELQVLGFSKELQNQMPAIKICLALLLINAPLKQK